MKCFLDSGAHSLYERVMKSLHKGSKRKGDIDYSYVETKEFWKYVDDYAEFIKQNFDHIDIYVNVDVIFNGEASWRVQEYLEKEHGLSPLPVFHPKEDFKWLRKYMDKYEYIGIGGLGQDMTKSDYYDFADKVFGMLCDYPDCLPRWKTHGFAMTSPDLLYKYPFFSVDSTSWVQFGRYGIILFPKQGRYDRSPYTIKVSTKSPSLEKADKHLQTMSVTEREYLEEVISGEGFTLGKSHFENGKEVVEEPGLSNDCSVRDKWNMLFFLRMEQALPKWPWAFKHKKGIFTGAFDL